MKRTFKIAAVVLALGAATGAYAAVDTAALISELSAQGYTVTEIKAGATTVKIEAINSTEKIELTYDVATGALLKRETQARTAASGSSAVPVLSTSGTGPASTDSVTADLLAQGFTVREIKSVGGTIKVEAYNGSQKIEVTYDAASGQILKLESDDGDDSDSHGSGSRSGGDHDDGDDDEGDDDDHDDDDDDDDDDEDEDDDDEDDDDHK
ncbi:MAG: hypothetical protein Q8Q63_00505 [Phaeovulum sp.]|uniref:hypothetical protein n=1 Tax=Phaeovulum sp. TaxID=2934796 RepID=UPI0027339B2E|nr:hypothetical protein [Phaeovulum sp.]MDP3860049.1 hypothetical protein [Phaeovulum sp.]